LLLDSTFASADELSMSKDGSDWYFPHWFEFWLPEKLNILILKIRLVNNTFRWNSIQLNLKFKCKIHRKYQNAVHTYIVHWTSVL
jgi:hypothetical protein